MFFIMFMFFFATDLKDLIIFQNQIQRVFICENPANLWLNNFLNTSQYVANKLYQNLNNGYNKFYHFKII